MRYIISIFLVSCLSFCRIFSQALPLIPLPSEIKQGTGVFTITSATKIVLKTDSSEVKKDCDLFLDLINPSTGLNIDYASSSTSPIIVEINPQIAHPEGYYLKVTTRDVTIRARTSAGIFYAFQTLRQLLPPYIESRSVIANQRWTIPVVEINDAPRFSYRGLMLDVARHFFPVGDVKRYIDLMSLYKYNYLHLHLTDDQGWRVELHYFPRLQSISAWRRETIIGHLNDEPRRYDGIRYGGYYTQAELRELIRYAADRHITIVPEINLPGHASALLAAYPELACSGGYFEVAREWGIFPNILCPREDTFMTLEHLLNEVMYIFPSKYIHIGGNDVPKEQWQKSEFCHNLKIQNNLQTDEQLHTWFMRRVAQIVQQYGRRAIGWDELLDGGNIFGATIMSRRGEQEAIEAAKKGYNIIMTPNRQCYFDYYQASRSIEQPLAQTGYLPLSMVYQYDPVPKKLTDDQKMCILGTQGNLWTEYIPDMRQAEYMTYPRACALAEVAWTPADKKSYNQFVVRLRGHSNRLGMMNVNFARHFLVN